jgi:UDP-N-acetylglucosamine--N-acetylmuramyl-(pentapeptide) pyrophosphoryl-undecaprenol N-acetylglucosamine transferase
VRRALTDLPPPRERVANRPPGEPPRLLVLGGSQGARILNETVPAALAHVPSDRRPLVRHQCGERTADLARAAYAAAGVEASVEPFIDDMAGAYAWADLVVCRAGAMTVAELTAVGVGAVLVPFAAAVDDHQTGNARWLVEAGAAELIAERELAPARLAATLERLSASPEARLAMAEAARRLARPDAAEAVANACLAVAEERR